MTSVHELRSQLRAKLSAGQTVHGTFVKLPMVEAVDMFADIGLDFIVIDREHSQLTSSEARTLIAHALALGIPCLVRVPEVDSAEINRLLEAGAVGIQLSMTVRAQQVSDLNRAARHAPEGGRSVSLTQVGAGFGAASLAEYLQAESAHPPILVCQIETLGTDDPLEVLAEGIDALFVGTTDLAVSIGLDHPHRSTMVEGVMEAVARATRTRGIFAGAWGADAQAAKQLADDGFGFLVVGSDLQLLSAAARGLGSQLGALSDAQST